MNSMQPMKDPAAGVATQLLPHLHLVSKYRYPITSNPSLETILGYLLEAPKIMRDLQPVQWQLLDSPQDGTLMLVWQPLEYLGTNFASDGYIWADAEHIFKSEVRGYTLEMFLQRSGYRAAGETMAMHSRRRYRLVPGNPNLGLPSTDTSLWIIHYSKASPRDTIPAASIPVMPHVHNQIQQRRIIQAQGQLVRKDFMLHDRANWPVINAPQGVPRPGTSGQIAPGPGHRRIPSLGVAEATLEEEEDISRGDVLDFMTPRDISRMRYEQHHEWMEEILESPYNVLQIIPTDLGLGRKGELEELTKDFFDAPISATQERLASDSTTKAGSTSAGNADKFVERASQKLADMQAELEKMKHRHNKRMEKLRRTTLLNSAEKRLRTSTNLREARSSSNSSSNPTTDQRPSEFGDDTVREVEDFLGKKLQRTSNVTCVSRGGLEDRYSNAALINGGTAGASTLPVKTPNGSAPPQPSDEQQQLQNDGAGPDQAMPSPAKVDSVVDGEVNTGQQEGTSVEDNELLEQGSETHEEDVQEQTIDHADTELPSLDDMGMDVDIDGLEDEALADANNDWVMIDDQAAPQEDVPELPQTTSPKEASETGANDGTEQNEIDDHQKPESIEPITTGSQPEQQEQQEQQQQQQPQHQFEPAKEPDPQPQPDLTDDHDDYGMGGEFDDADVDTAGDALASYGDEDDLNLDTMDDSAFGDAFHPEDHDLD